jgi:Leucine-rich repeat (LRR) protein
MRTAKTSGLLAALACLLVSLPQIAVAENPVDFRDAKLKAAVEAQLGKTNPTPTQLLALRDLDARGKGIIDLTGLEYAANLTSLYLGANQVTDLSPLAGLDNLTWLDLAWNQISDVSPLGASTKLASLDLTWNKIGDLSPLAGLTHLTELYIAGNKATDLSPLAGLTNLTWLDLTGNHISSLSPLAGLSNLAGLQLASTGISDLSALARLTSLTWLYLGGNQISDISPLDELTNLAGLYLWDNQIADISALAGLTKLTSLELENNEIIGISPLAGLTKLTALDLESNQVRDVSPLAGLTSLTQLTLASNQISEISALAGPANVKELALENNQISDISPLVGLMKLTRLTVQNNPLNSKACVYLNQIHANNPKAYLRPEPCAVRCTLTVSSPVGGVVTSPGQGAFQYDSGTVVTAVAKATSGWQFAAWAGTAVAAGKVADPNAPRTTVTVDNDYTLQATFQESVWQFQERWETAAPGVYTPSKSASFDADEGPWALGDGLSSSGTRGATPNRAEVLKLDNGQALLLSSEDSKSACSDAVWVALDQSSLASEGPLVIDPNTVIRFNEVGRLDAPGPQGPGKDCQDPPCFDNVSLLLTDNRGNRLAYVLQRPADANANVPNALVGDTYREVFLDRSGVSYQRNLFTDFNTIPAFNAADARIGTIEFRVAEHGSAIIDNIAIGPGGISGQIPVYHFWSPVLETHFFTVGPEEKQYLIDTWANAWTFQGISYFTLPEGSDPNLTPVYRFWSPTFSSHFYTISEAERDNLVANYPKDWTPEGIAFYVFAEGRQPTDAAPVYRFWSGSLGCHFYTANTKERDEMVQNHSDTWTLEGIAWHAYPPQWDSQQALETVGGK